MADKNKKVIIGIDGAPFEMIDDLSEKGVMPNFQDLKGRGAFVKMRSSMPDISSVAWSSIITGQNPGEHGIYGFTDLIPNTYSLSFPDFKNLKKPAFWHKNKDRKHVILNVPFTYPARELNGVHISGFVSLDLERALYPQKYLPKLKEIGYKTDVDVSVAHESKSLFLEKLSEVNEARIKTYRYFWEKEDWDTFMLVFTGSDRLEHFLWDAYEEENHQYHQDFLNYFQRVDEIIGEIAGRIDKETSLLILSDHGMERIKANFNVNCFLKEKGFLKLDPQMKGYNQIIPGTRAFALDPGRIYINKRSRYPKGGVEGKEEKEVIEQLIEAFGELEKDGEKVVKNVYRKEEIYKGAEMDRAPDLVLLGTPGYRLKGAIGKDEPFEEDIFTGKHTLDNAFLYVKGKEKEALPASPTVEDFEPILKGN